MAVAASGLDIQQLFSKYLFKPFGMSHTSWSSGAANPSMAAGIRTTGADFDSFLHKLLTYSVLPKAVLDEMETDWTKPPARPSGDGWFGHYGMGHWWECMGYGTPDEHAALPKACTDAAIQAGPGEYGFYPLLDRSGGGGEAGPKRPPYYFQVVLQEPDPLSGVPEYLRLAAKPVVDLILAGEDPQTAPRQKLLDLGGGLITRDITYIQSELSNCTCTKKPKSHGEPYNTLMAHLPSDNAKLNRRTYSKYGAGLLLRDITHMQASLGRCYCSGRWGSDADATAAADSMADSDTAFASSAAAVEA
jgi:hypothetical protein